MGLYGACSHGHINVVKLVLERNVDVSQDGDTPLYIACSGGHFEIVKLLIEKK